MSEFLIFLEDEVQIFALLFLGIVYILRLVWLFRFKSSKEKTTAAGKARAGIVYSLANVAMPWAMESTRKRPVFYSQFILFHLGVTAAIAASFIIPYWPILFESFIAVIVFQIIIGSALLVGLLRLYRRIITPALKYVSSADDYFSLILTILFFASAVFAVPNRYEQSEWPLILFFSITAFFLMYVPFSKICHYLYYPFTRFFLGRTQGHRGVLYKRNLEDRLKNVPEGK